MRPCADRAEARPVDELPARAAAARADGDPTGIVEERIGKNDGRAAMMGGSERLYGVHAGAVAGKLGPLPRWAGG